MPPPSALPLLADVALPLPVPRLYSYAVPDEFAADLAVGSRVLVPLGGQRLIGYVAAVARREPPPGLKPVLDLIDETPLLDEGLVAFAVRLAEYYLCSTGEVLKAALPPGINGTVRCWLEEQADPALRRPLRLTPRREAILRLVRERGTVSRSWLAQEMGGAFHHDLNQLIAAGHLIRRDALDGERRRAPTRRVLGLVHPAGTPEFRAQLAERERRAPRQAALMLLLGGTGDGRLERSDVLAQGWTPAVIRSLAQGGVLREDEEEAEPSASGYDLDASVRDIILTDEQEQVAAAVVPCLPGPGRRPGRFQPFLLRGVTGSGKTQVYLELARRTRAAGGGVLVLVPEIALTPQIVARFQGYLGQDVAVIHSQLSGAQRFAIWRALREGSIRVVVGARSALFAPIRRLGLIVVDEEHESSFKQAEPAPRYHARDAAVLRAQQLGIPILMGSATPSLESWWNVRQGRYQLLELPRRVADRPLPPVELVDMKAERDQLAGRGRTQRNFSGVLVEALLAARAAGRQTILLQNRRGHSPWLQCPACGEVLHCPRCDVSLVWHRSTGQCHCHLCGLELPTPEACPACRGAELGFLGAGTQKIEEELAELLPDVRLLRMDRDTTRRRGAYIRMVRDFNEGRFEVLLGTQGVAKGLDFTGVTLAGVIQADTELNLQDFRAREWGFQLVSQLAGRAGRGELPGRVVVQTMTPDHPVLRQAAAHDYLGFADEELEVRHQSGYPPFTRLCRLLVKSADEVLAERACRRLYDEVPRPARVGALNPGPAPVRMVRREYRFHLLLRSRRDQDAGGRRLREAALACREYFNKSLKERDLSLIIDMDPQGVM